MHHQQAIRQGDFSFLAKEYIHRTGYSLSVLRALFLYAQLDPSRTITADVGAGTGKLTENLIELGFKGFAIEPNDAMRAEGIRLCKNVPFTWSKGSAENTGLHDRCVDWVLMGSSFHWTDSQKALKEFHRILKPGGFFVALWNPRDLNDPFQAEIENWIHEQVPNIKRKSSGAGKYTLDLEKRLIEGGYFKDPIFMEAPHAVKMSKERYLGIWKSVNDVRSQAGEEAFRDILNYISEKVSDKSLITVPYKTRAWMVQAI